MGIMDIFKTVTGQNNTPAPAPAPVQMLPGNIPANPGVPANPNNPTAPADSNLNSKTPESPMAQYSELWKNDPNAGNNPPAPMFNIKPEDVLRAAQQVDFKTLISPELATRIQGGGEDGMRATIEAMNAVAQNTYAQSAIAGSKIAEEAAKKAVQEVTRKIPGMIKQHSARDAFLEENAALNDPALKPLVTSIQGRIQQKFPDASASQLQSMTNDFMVKMAEQIVAGQEKRNPTKPEVRDNRNQDWSKFLE